MRLLFTCVALAMLPFIHGCAALAIGGVAAGSYMVGEDRRPVKVMTVASTPSCFSCAAAVPDPRATPPATSRATVLCPATLPIPDIILPASHRSARSTAWRARLSGFVLPARGEINRRRPATPSRVVFELLSCSERHDSPAA